MTRTSVILAAAALVAIPVGVGAAALVAPDGQAPRATTRVVHAGPALLTVPAGWRSSAPAEGLEAERTATLSPGPAARAVVTFGPADDRSLLPRDLRALVGDPLPAPRAATLGGRPAVVYRDLEAGERLLNVTVLPTTAGMLAVACPAPGDCAGAVTAASVPGTTALIPSPAIPLAAHLPAAIARLDGETIAGRDDLGDARTPTAQAGAAARLAGRQRAAAASLRSRFGAAAEPVSAALEEGGRAYDALSAAAQAGAPTAFAAAREDVRAAESHLTAAVDATLRAGTRPSAAPAPVAPPAPPPAGTPGIVRFAGLLLVALLLAGSLAAGFLSSGAVARTITRAARRLSAPT
jgi:hypothetical protein